LYISDPLNPSHVALIDLDPSGPTLQYNFNVPTIAKALATNPERWPPNPDPDSDWSYPTFDDLVDLGTDPSLAVAAASGHDDNEWLNKLSVTVLPDSLTVTGIFVASKFFNSVERIKILTALDDLILKIKKKHGEKIYVIIDLGPGMFGTNGTLFRYMSSKYHTSMILMSSPRSFDIANSMYEGIWLSAQGFLLWNRNVLQLLNMWPPEGTESETHVNDYMAEFIEDYFTRILDSDFSAQPNGKVASANYIMFWRLRSYVYKIAVDQAEGETPVPRSDSKNKLRY